MRIYKNKVIENIASIFSGKYNILGKSTDLIKHNDFQSWIVSHSADGDVRIIKVPYRFKFNSNFVSRIEPKNKKYNIIILVG